MCKYLLFNHYAQLTNHQRNGFLEQKCSLLINLSIKSSSNPHYINPPQKKYKIPQNPTKVSFFPHTHFVGHQQSLAGQLNSIDSGR
jgi:hypothetical protein